MLVAVKDFVWRDPDFGLVWLKAGCDRVAADHPMFKDAGVRDNFAPADPLRLRRRKRGPAASAMRTPLKAKPRTTARAAQFGERRSIRMATTSRLPRRRRTFATRNGRRRLPW
jgi:hypothetical protein